MCQSICSTHGTALIYGSDTHAAANELFFFARKKQSSIFLFALFSLFFAQETPHRAGSIFTFNVSLKYTSKSTLSKNFVSIKKVWH